MATVEATIRTTLVSIVGAALLAASVSCGDEDSSRADTAGLPQGSEPFQFDPGGFTSEIDHPFWPMKPGTRWVYRETDSEGTVSRVVVTVTSRTKTIMGVKARVVHDRVTEGGKLKEDTFDWYAQDSDGNLWYLGEDTTEYEDGKPKSKEGSWEAGVDGAYAGILLPADPRVGMTYREEYYEGHAEDGAEILSLDALATVPYGRFDHALQTRNFSGIEPNVIEEKLYARGVGVVLEITVSGGSDRSELVSVESVS